MPQPVGPRPRAVPTEHYEGARVTNRVVPAVPTGVSSEDARSARSQRAGASVMLRALIAASTPSTSSGVTARAVDPAR